MNRLLTIAFVAAPLALAGGAWAQTQAGDASQTEKGLEKGLQGPQDMPQGDSANPKPMNAPSGPIDTSKRPELTTPSSEPPSPSDTVNNPAPRDQTKQAPSSSGNPGELEH
jgi:hypothetical protein